MPAAPNPKRRILLIWVHGFKGDETTFLSFPQHLADAYQAVHPTWDVQYAIYPKYKTVGELKDCTEAFVGWVDRRVAFDREWDVEAEDLNGQAVEEADGRLPVEVVGDAEKRAGQCSSAGGRIEERSEARSDQAVTDVVLIGHSMGGLLIADAAAIWLKPKHGEERSQAPLRIQGVIALDTPFIGIHPSYGVDQLDALVARLHTSSTSFITSTPSFIQKGWKGIGADKWLRPPSTTMFGPDSRIIKGAQWGLDLAAEGSERGTWADLGLPAINAKLNWARNGNAGMAIGVEAEAKERVKKEKEAAKREEKDRKEREKEQKKEKKMREKEVKVKRKEAKKIEKNDIEDHKEENTKEDWTGKDGAQAAERDDEVLEDVPCRENAGKGAGEKTEDRETGSRAESDVLGDVTQASTRPTINAESAFIERSPPSPASRTLPPPTSSPLRPQPPSHRSTASLSIPTAIPTATPALSPYSSRTPSIVSVEDASELDLSVDDPNFAIQKEKCKKRKGWRWLQGHLVFVSSLWRTEEVWRRMRVLGEMQKDGLGFTNIYTVVPCPSSRPVPASHKAMPATFISLPGPSQPTSNSWRPFEIDVTDQVTAHMALFMRDKNTRYDELMSMIMDELDAAME